MLSERINQILSRFTNLSDRTDAISASKAAIAVMIREGWNDDEIVKLYRLTEEYNPELQEDIALSKARILYGKVRARLNKTNSLPNTIE